MKPDNKYCEKCSWYDGNNQLKFLNKYGYPGCSGIPFSSGEFPYDHKVHCFTDEKILTTDEKRIKDKERILKMIKTLKPEEAAEAISKEFKNANI